MKKFMFQFISNMICRKYYGKISKFVRGNSCKVALKFISRSSCQNKSADNSRGGNWRKSNWGRICAWPFKEKPDFQGADILTIGNGLQKNFVLLNSAIILSTEGGINFLFLKPVSSKWNYSNSKFIKIHRNFLKIRGKKAKLCWFFIRFNG